MSKSNSKGIRIRIPICLGWVGPSFASLYWFGLGPLGGGWAQSSRAM